MKKLLFSSLIFLLFSGSAFGHGDDEPAEESSSTTLSKVELNNEQQKILHIRTKMVEMSEVQPSINLNGTIEGIPQLRFQVNAPLPGRVSSINVGLGSQVVKGQILAVLNSQEVTQFASVGLTEQATYRSQVTQAQANLDLEKKKYEREKALYDNRINAQKDLEAAETGYKDAQASLKAAQQNLQIATNSTQTRLNQIGSSQSGQISLRAPQNGQISVLNLTAGQTVDSGQILFEGVNLSQVWASGAVFEKDVNKVRLGQKVKVFNPSSQKTYTGKIVFVSPTIDSIQRSFFVKALLQNPQAELKIGQFVQMLVEVDGQAEKAILLEKDSLVEKNGEYFVYVRSGKYLAPVKVEISKHKHQDYVEIESGLAVGDEVVVEGSYLLPSKGKIENPDEHDHEEEKSEKKEIPLWMWLTGGGVLILGAFFVGKTTALKRKEIL